MKGKITFTYKQRFKKSEYYESPFLFDPLDNNIRYAYPIGEAIRINFGGEIIDIDYDRGIWKALEQRFSPKKTTTGFKPIVQTKKPKLKRGG